jgi:hypothetical protein
VCARAGVCVSTHTHTHTHTYTGQKASSTAFIATDSRGEPLLVLVPRGPQDGVQVGGTVEQYSLKLQHSSLQESSQKPQRQVQRPLLPTKQTNTPAIRTIFTDVARGGGGEGEEAGGDVGAQNRVEACGLEFLAALDALAAVPVTDSSGICMFMHTYIYKKPLISM